MYGASWASSGAEDGRACFVFKSVLINRSECSDLSMIYIDLYDFIKLYRRLISIRHNRCLHISWVVKWQQCHDLYRQADNTFVSLVGILV